MAGDLTFSLLGVRRAEGLRIVVVSATPHLLSVRAHASYFRIRGVVLSGLGIGLLVLVFLLRLLVDVLVRLILATLSSESPFVASLSVCP